MTVAALSDALAALTRTASSVGLDPQAAVAEAGLLSAAISEGNPGAYLDWCAVFDQPPSAQAFADAAVAGRRYRGSATPLATQSAANTRQAHYAAALAAVCQASATLGEPTAESLGAATIAAAAQLPSATPGLSADQAFVQQAPAVLNEVLHRMAQNQRRLLDVSALDPQLPGAFGSFGIPSSTGGSPSSAAGTPPAHQETAPESPPLPDTPELPEKTVDEWLAELDQLVGLAEVKTEIRRQTAILRVDALRTKAGLHSPTITRHLVFVGNPGTGKTTVARLVAGIYKAIGLLSKGQLVEVDRSELVAGYLGQTAIKTAEITAKAYGGVLFIDEAYSLNGDQYGEEAINTLVKEMEDHRDDLVVIVAGYPDPMNAFVANNPGLASRFRTTVEFSDYSDDELRAIFSAMASHADFDLGDGALDQFSAQLAAQPRDEHFGNGRFARNLLEAAIGRHAWRLRDVAEPTLAQLRTLLKEDLSDIEPPVVVPDSETEPR